MPELIALIRHARLVITNGADTLLQVLALDRPPIAVSLSPDQTQRLARLAAQGVSVEVPLDAGVIESRAGELLGNADALEAHAALGRRLELQDGLATAADAIEALLR
jgi:UDP:flavonoid glycosyltransferase YjiC (YdhE family)